jgi:hypothetical protein
MTTGGVSKHLAAAAALGLALLAACGDDSDGDGDGGDIGGDDAPGQACEIDGACPASSTLCFAAGKPSSCQSGGLCVGGPSGVACAEPCSSDADCEKQGPASVCLLDCEEPLLNGYCTTPDQSAELLEFPFCTTPADPRRGIAGSS